MNENTISPLAHVRTNTLPTLWFIICFITILTMEALLPPATHGGKQPPPPSLESILVQLHDPKRPVRQAAAQSLVALQGRKATGHVLSMLEQADIQDAQWLIQMLGDLHDPKSYGALADLLGQPDGRIKKFAAAALKKLSTPQDMQAIGELFIQGIHSDDPALHVRCGSLFRLFGGKKCLQWLRTSDDDLSKNMNNALRLRSGMFRLTHSPLYNLGLCCIRKMKNRPLVMEELLGRLRTAVENHDYNKQTIISTLLLQLNDPLAAPFYHEVLMDKELYWPNLRADGCCFFAGTSKPEIVALLRDIILDPATETNLRTKAIISFTGNGNPQVENFLVTITDDMTQPVALRRAAMDGLAAVENERLLDLLLMLINTKREPWLLQAHGLELMGKMDDPAGLAALLKLVESEDYELFRIRIIEILKTKDDPLITQTLQRVSEQDRFVMVRNRASKALGKR